MNVFVGLSGGVDSAVSAALLQQQGFDVVGVFIRIALPGYPCTAGTDKIEAMRVAAHLHIPFIEIDLSSEYEQAVFQTSVREFAKGNTPNPDTLCNKEIKFGVFYHWAMAHGADLVATGHYAQLQHNADGSVELLAGKDAEKDQSYFLWMVPEEALRHTRFPVGGMEKREVRALAKKFALPNATRKDSQGLCFLGDISIAQMLNKELTLVPGDVLSEQGEVIGTHDGAALYTLGQRHGFMVTALPTKNQTRENEQVHSKELLPHFVISKDIAHNTITVSTERYPKNKTCTSVLLRNVQWIGDVAPGACSARFRYRQELIPATLEHPTSNSENRATVILQAPHYVPEGQSLVLYRGERCLGGGIIERGELG